jgi:hypothetical protein
MPSLCAAFPLLLQARGKVAVKAAPSGSIQRTFLPEKVGKILQPCFPQATQLHRIGPGTNRTTAFVAKPAAGRCPDPLPPVHRRNGRNGPAVHPLSLRVRGAALLG